jgi:hypothetical protein
MKRLAMLFLLVTVLALTIIPGSVAVTDCGAQLQVAYGKVLCCCQTGNGGTCCNYVTFCGGSYIPGCFCS